MAALTALHTYRQLLREVNRQFTKTNDIFAKQLKTIYRDNQGVTDPSKVEALNRNAENVLTYLRSSRQHKELRDMYSAIVLEQKKRIELSAKRVGLEMPKQYSPEEASTDRVMKAFQK
ncbi:hypothetical protein BDB00DRAFT_798475 [Zychaea mexicana]|uniref:uncharacterized protein n=1 Tax=Zychaea mexicana TaxID=64656 RepID=UPI0022FE9544|nr:uncharacterized protein BDB00DRAFT_798475 [Zychaea mexicana]KAI9498557.1 hypothetical protein BDB00DRAFT_798475 [Zychaea mexicana]